MSFLDFRPEGHPTTRCPQLKGLGHDKQLLCPVGQAFVRKVPRSLFHYALGQGQNDYGGQRAEPRSSKEEKIAGPRVHFENLVDSFVRPFLFPISGLLCPEANDDDKSAAPKKLPDFS